MDLVHRSTRRSPSCASILTAGAPNPAPQRQASDHGFTVDLMVTCARTDFFSCSRRGWLECWTLTSHEIRLRRRIPGDFVSAEFPASHAYGTETSPADPHESGHARHSHGCAPCRGPYALGWPSYHFLL
ncbi:unnamed protein product [Urochloa humidicola]